LPWLCLQGKVPPSVYKFSYSKFLTGGERR